MSSIEQAMLEKINELNFEIQRLSRRVQMLTHASTLGNQFTMPGSKYWTWYQKNTSQVQTISTGKTLVLIDTKEMPGTAGYYHSADAQTDNDVFFKGSYFTPDGKEQVISGHFSDFRAAGFNKFIPASAGDPIVMNDPTDGGPAIPAWKLRVSPSWNVPFNTPFHHELTNDAATIPTVTVYGYDYYFWLLTGAGHDLVDSLEAEDIDPPPILTPFVFKEVPVEGGQKG